MTLRFPESQLEPWLLGSIGTLPDTCRVPAFRFPWISSVAPVTLLDALMLNLPLLSFTGKLTKPCVVWAPSSQFTGMTEKLKPFTCGFVFFPFFFFFFTTLKLIEPDGLTTPT